MDVLTTDDEILIEARYPVPPEQVWAALTGPEAILAWWGQHVSLDARLGGEFHETSPGEGGRLVTTTGTVTTCDPPHTLELTWQAEGWSEATRVRITLRPETAGRTLLRLAHSGWEAFPLITRAVQVEAHIDGWTYHLRSLLGYLLRQEGLL